MKKARKPASAEKVRTESYYFPSKSQHDYCLNNFDLFVNPELMNAANIIISGFISNEQVHQDYLNIVNQAIRKF